MIPQQMTYVNNDYNIIVASATVRSLPANQTSISVQQQQYTGLVVNEENDPIPGVNINIRGKNKTALSDENGRFRVAAAPGDTLEVSHISYQKRQYNLRGEHQLALEIGQ